eukprot:gene4027-7283_t
MDVCGLVTNGKFELLQTSHNLKPYLPILSYTYYNTNSSHLFSVLQKYSEVKDCIECLELNWEKFEKIEIKSEDLEYKFENGSTEDRIKVVLQEIEFMEGKNEYTSILFQNDLWFDEVSMILSIAFFKLEMNKNFLLKLNENYVISLILNHSYMFDEIISILENRTDLLYQISTFSNYFAQKIRFKYRKNIDLCLSISSNLKDTTSFMSILSNEELSKLKTIPMDLQLKDFKGLKLAIKISVFSNIWVIEKLDIKWVFQNQKRILLFLCLCLTNLKNSFDVLKETLKKLKETSQCLDTLLLLATYIHSSDYKKIVEFVVKTTQISTIVQLHNLEYLDFIKELIPLSYLAQQILKSTSLHEDYVFQCVHQLLKGKLFRKMEIDISNWVWSVITKENPKTQLIFPIIISLVENSTMHPSFSFCMKLFKEDDISKIFESGSILVQSFLLYYILSYNSYQEGYSLEILDKCDVISIIEYLQLERKELGNFYSQLLSLIVEQLQHLFHFSFYSSKNHAIKNISIDAILDPLKDQKKTKHILDLLLISDHKKYEDDIIKMYSILNQSLETEKYLKSSYLKLWRKLYGNYPMKIALKTVNSTLNLDLQNHKEIYKNILVLFKMEFLDEIFLQILESYMIASRKYIQSISKDKDHSQMLILTQDSTIIQILLEKSLKLKSKQLIFTFIHQRFIENPNIAKMVHFQTYPISLIQHTIHGIESMHICMDFLHEILNQTSFEKKIFGIVLTSYLVEKYPTQRCVELTNNSITQMKNILSNYSNENKYMIVQCLEAFKRFHKTFPFLDCYSVLQNLKWNDEITQLINNLDLH